MPRAKRAKVVTLNKSRKKAPDSKVGYVSKVEGYLKKYERVFVFQYINMTTAPLKKITESILDSKFCFAKRKLMKLAFGNEEKSPYTNSHLIAEHLKGDTGLFFSNKTPEDCEAFFRNFAHPEFANPGTPAITTVELMPGKEVFQKFSSSNEGYLRKLGVDVVVEDGKICLEKPFLAAEVGEPLSVNGSRVLKFLGVKLSEFKLMPLCQWDKTGKFKVY